MPATQVKELVGAVVASVNDTPDEGWLVKKWKPSVKFMMRFYQSNLKRLWKTDFVAYVLSSSVSTSIEDKRALEIMERSLKLWMNNMK